ncbi:Transcriptional adapter 2-alpha [Ophiophagus hannah]|uniref:Transcriptional adapter 2-alpha n=1 Tax=Ophiophagus hannah TaxID=8665 RepID=V8NR25_OPHHA|nr:Transcriptional adapter 2-alpha [Ophiophagus hannah]
MDHLASFSSDPFDKPPCRGCSSYLAEPYIKCAECSPPPFLLCLQTSNFPVLDPTWTAQEEMALLEAVMDCGFGNWQDVANQMSTKTKEECEKHYMKHFINNPLFASSLLHLKQAGEKQQTSLAIPFYGKCQPQRKMKRLPVLLQAFKTATSLLETTLDMAGYMPARADFIEEFDNYAEWDLRDIDFVEDDSDLLHALKIAVVDIYHSRLKERQRRKKKTTNKHLLTYRIIKDHGLINLRKFQRSHSWLNIHFLLCFAVLERRYPKKVQDLYESMRRFARILGPTEHDKFIESHARARTYDRLKKVREEERLKRTMLSEVLQYIQDSSACQQWLSRQADIDSGLSLTVPITSNSGRRSAPPLNLTGLPGTEKLNEKEKELCQIVRLVPGAYLEYKAALVNECHKQGGLRLAQARALIKIDVNKTRKIYDFLIREGSITKA